MARKKKKNFVEEEFEVAFEPIEPIVETIEDEEDEKELLVTEVITIPEKSKVESKKEISIIPKPRPLVSTDGKVKRGLLPSKPSRTQKQSLISKSIDFSRTFKLNNLRKSK